MWPSRLRLGPLAGWRWVVPGGGGDTHSINFGVHLESADTPFFIIGGFTVLLDVIICLQYNKIFTFQSTLFCIIISGLPLFMYVFLHAVWTPAPLLFMLYAMGMYLGIYY